MIDLYLRADTEPALKSALPWAVAGTGDWVAATDAYALDPIGPLALTAPLVDAAGTVVTPGDVDPRCHANLRLLDETLAAAVPESVRIFPAQPRRDWA